MQLSKPLSVLMVMLCYLSYVSPSDAQDYNHGLSKGSNLGTVVVPIQPAPLRMTPPGLFGVPGEETGKTSKSQSYVILKGKVVPGFFSVDRWIMIAPTQSDGTVQPNNGGWVYWGKGNMDHSPNFQAMSPDEVDPKIRSWIENYVYKNRLNLS